MVLSPLIWVSYKVADFRIGYIIRRFQEEDLCRIHNIKRVDWCLEADRRQSKLSLKKADLQAGCASCRPLDQSF